MGIEVALLAASTAFSVMQQQQQAKAQAAMYDIQAKTAIAQGERKALQYEQRANETRRRVLAANASANAHRKADIVFTANLRNAGRDIMNDISNARFAILGGNTQSEINSLASDIASQSGMLSSAAKIAETGYGLYKTGIFEGRTTNTASTSSNIVGTPNTYSQTTLFG